jgi:uncharacterized protein (DUF4415 family)
MPRHEDPDFIHGFPREVWEEVSDNPELTAEDFKLAKPFREVFPELAAEIERSRGRPVSDNPKKQVTLRLDADVLARYKAGGKGWQSRVNADLRKALGL